MLGRVDGDGQVAREPAVLGVGAERDVVVVAAEVEVAFVEEAERARLVRVEGEGPAVDDVAEVDRLGVAALEPALARRSRLVEVLGAAADLVVEGLARPRSRTRRPWPWPRS